MADEHAIKAQKVRDEIWGLPPDMTANVIAAALREAVAAERKRCAGVAKRRRVAVWDTMKGGRRASHPAEEMAVKALSDVVDAIEQGD